MAYRLRVYVAGPESFLVDGPEIAVRKERLCGSHELECLQSDKSSQDHAVGSLDFGRAYAKCVALMLRADFGIFNLTPISGSMPDAGTIFRLGVMTALGKPAYAYMNQALDALECHEDLNHVIENSIISSYFAMQNRQIVLKAVPAKARFSDLVGFEECLRSAKQDTLQSLNDNLTAAGLELS